MTKIRSILPALVVLGSAAASHAQTTNALQTAAEGAISTANTIQIAIQVAGFAIVTTGIVFAIIKRTARGAK